MSSLARYCLKNNVLISGYDKTRNEECIDLEAQGVKIYYDLHCVSEIDQLSADTYVVYSAAIGNEHPLLKKAIERGLNTAKRAVFLAQLVNNTRCFAIAGTHGKTTTTALLSHIFAANNLSFTAFIGGYSHDLKSNFYPMLQLGALIELGLAAPAALVMAGVWSRVAPLWAMARFQYLRRDGTAGFHRRHRRPLWDALPSAAVLLVLAMLQTPVMVLAGAPVALVVAEGLGRRLGGHTGDSYGAVLVLTETFTLVLLALAT